MEARTGRAKSRNWGIRTARRARIEIQKARATLLPRRSAWAGSEPMQNQDCFASSCKHTSAASSDADRTTYYGGFDPRLCARRDACSMRCGRYTRTFGLPAPAEREEVRRAPAGPGWLERGASIKKSDYHMRCCRGHVDSDYAEVFSAARVKISSICCSVGGHSTL